MSKRKKTTQPNGEGVVSVPIEGDLTSPDLAPNTGESAAKTPAETPRQPNGEMLGEHVFDSAEPDTQVGPAPTADSWDGPTNVGTEDELAELAAASVSSVEEQTVLAEEPVLAEDEAAPLEGAAVPPETAAAAPDGAGAEVEGDPLPEVAPGRLASIIESLLFASDHPLTLAELKRLVGERDGGKLTAAIDDLRARRQESGVQVMQAAGGWHLRTNPENVAWVARILAGKPPRLSRALLETLAIVAYRQPITRPEIDEIRGVDCGPVLKTLLERSLVRMIGKKEEVGRPILYGTTPEFLRTFSLRDLSELPTLREFHELGEAEMAKVAAATPAGAFAAEPPPRPAAIREPDPAEEDALLNELDQATAAASQAAVVPVETPVTVEDETVG
jgi:segregation and condensation protein B